MAQPDHDNSAHTGLRRARSRADTFDMIRPELTRADHRIGPRAAADSGTNVSGPTAVLVPIGNAAGARQNRRSSVPVSPARPGPISSPANGCSSSCYALRSIGPSHDGECVAVRLIHVHDDDPDGEAA